MPLNVTNLTDRIINFKKWNQLANKYKFYPIVVIASKLMRNNMRGITIFKPTILIFDDEKETDESLFWVFCHEFRHSMLPEKEDATTRYLDIMDNKMNYYFKDTLSAEEKLDLDNVTPKEIDATVFANQQCDGKYYGFFWKKMKTDENLLPIKKDKIKNPDNKVPEGLNRDFEDEHEIAKAEK